VPNPAELGFWEIRGTVPLPSGRGFWSYERPSQTEGGKSDVGKRKKTYEEINERIKRGEAVVVTADEVVSMARESGLEEVVEKVDVVTTATFGAMCSSGAFLNFGHSDPPIKMSKVWLNDVPAYAGIAAVDAYIGATELSEREGIDYGGAHIIEDLVSGKRIRLKAISYGTDCYPRREIETYIDKDSINEAFLFNPRNAYQNYAAATNSTNRILHTYMGTLLPRFGNVTYSTAGQLSPLLNDPEYVTVGIGTRIFLAGAQGYVAWNGTQHYPSRQRGPNGVPVGGAGTIAVIGDLKQMNPKYLRAARFYGYGVSLYVGIGVPIPVLDEEIARWVSVSDAEIMTGIYDYGVPSRQRPLMNTVSYAQLRSGSVQVDGKRTKTAPLSSLAMAREIAETLKSEIQAGAFFLTEPVARLPLTATSNQLAAGGEK
jgi:uncharacterized protein (DUF39 family)